MLLLLGKAEDVDDVDEEDEFVVVVVVIVVVSELIELMPESLSPEWSLVITLFPLIPFCNLPCLPFRSSEGDAFTMFVLEI